MDVAMENKRLFVALKVPSEVQKEIFRLVSSDTHKGVTWQRDEKMHITLYFIGEVNLPQQQRIIETLRSVIIENQLEKFIIRLNEIESCGTRSLRIRFDINEEFSKLTKAIQSSLNQLGYTFKFSGGHVTLARLQEKQLEASWIADFVKKHSEVKLPQFAVNDVVLLRSDVKKGVCLDV